MASTLGNLVYPLGSSTELLPFLLWWHARRLWPVVKEERFTHFQCTDHELQHFVAHLEARCGLGSTSATRGLRWLVILNPNAGKGRALTVFEQQVRWPFFQFLPVSSSFLFIFSFLRSLMAGPAGAGGRASLLRRGHVHTQRPLPRAGCHCRARVHGAGLPGG